MLVNKIQLDTDETILLQVRKHWFILSIQLVGVLVVALFPPLVYMLLLSTSQINLAEFGFSGSILGSLYIIWLILSWMALFSVWTNYYLDVWTITNKRLIAVDQRGLFHRETGSFRLERLQDINVSVRGILGTLLGYGDLHAETASGDRDFLARNIPKPQEVKALILKAADDVTYTSHEIGKVDATGAIPTLGGL